MGDTIVPNKIPNLYHSLFNGDKNLEFNTPKTKKIKDKIVCQRLSLLLVQLAKLDIS